MRKKKTAPHTRRHQKTSSPKKLGLIVRENKNQQSARTKSVLDNRFHRTALPTEPVIHLDQERVLLVVAEQITELIENAERRVGGVSRLSVVPYQEKC